MTLSLSSWTCHEKRRNIRECYKTTSKRCNSNAPCSVGIIMSSILVSTLLLLFQCPFTLATVTATANNNKNNIKSSIVSSSSPACGILHQLSDKSQDTFLDIRGGAALSDDDEYDDYEENEEGKEMETTIVDTIMDVLLDTSKKFVMLLGRVTLETAYALQRAVEAGISANDVEEEDEKASIVVKICNIVKRMWHAAIHVPSDHDKEGDDVDDITISTSFSPKKKEQSKRREKATTSTSAEIESSADNDSEVDFGSYLVQAYNINIGKENKDASNSKKEMVRGRTLNDALRYARSQARLLVVYIPSSPPRKKDNSSYDKIAIQSITSQEVSFIARKKSIKTKKGEGKKNYGSFVLWSTKAGSLEATTAIKRLKLIQKRKGQKNNNGSPILVVIYPAQVIDSSGRPKVIPRVLSQHHCNPPPTSESMASWLNALRKRHAKQYATMQHELQEIQYYEERKKGYKESMVGDTKRNEEEKIEKEKRLAREKEEKERIERIEQRREVLREELPEEPSPSSATESVVTIALRFADGRTGKRRFDCETELNELFNWVDGYYDMEREKVILSTMNGQRSFKFVDGEAEKGEEGRSETMTLKEAGFGRMTGLRVSERKEDKDDDNNDDDKEEEEDND